MNLLPKEMLKHLPLLGSTDTLPCKDKQAVVKFFTPDANWTWYACEFDGNDIFFGFVVGWEREWGYFSLSELQMIRGPLGLPIERDVHFEPQPIAPYLTDERS